MARQTTFDRTYDDLVRAWMQHEDRRGSGDLEALYESRRRLDEVRYQMALIRQ